MRDNDKGPNWLGPSLENHNLLRDTPPKNLFFENQTHEGLKGEVCSFLHYEEHVGLSVLQQ